MPVDRFYVPVDFNVDQLIALEDQEFHHLVHVARVKEGESIEIVNGKGALGQALVEKIGKHNALLKLLSVVKQPLQSFEVILALAIPRMNRLDYILEKGTELGMTQIWLFSGELSEKKFSLEERDERLTSMMIAAMKQCGRLFLPRIEYRSKLLNWNGLSYQSFFGDLSNSAPLFKNIWEKSTDKKGLIFFVGPESGFSEPEEMHMRSLGAKGVRLHENILRTDTACIAALSIISQFLLD